MIILNRVAKIFNQTLFIIPMMKFILQILTTNNNKLITILKYHIILKKLKNSLLILPPNNKTFQHLLPLEETLINLSRIKTLSLLTLFILFSCLLKMAILKFIYKTWKILTKNLICSAIQIIWIIEK